MLQIPISSKAPHFSQESDIFGQSFNLEFEWLNTEQFWVLHIYDHTEQPLALGIKLQSNWPLFSYWQDEKLLVLLLIANHNNAVPNLANLAKDFYLVAYEAI